MVPPHDLPLSLHLQSLVHVVLSLSFSLGFISCACVSSVRLEHGSVDIDSSSDSNQSREGDLIERDPSAEHGSGLEHSFTPSHYNLSSSSCSRQENEERLS